MVRLSLTTLSFLTAASAWAGAPAKLFYPNAARGGQIAVQIAQGPADSAPSVRDVSGSWDVLNLGQGQPSYQTCVTITQSGATVTGVVNYENVPGRTTPGTLSGQISGQTLVLSFRNQVSRGRLSLVVSSDGISAKGTWILDEMIQKDGTWQKVGSDHAGYTGDVFWTHSRRRAC